MTRIFSALILLTGSLTFAQQQPSATTEKAPPTDSTSAPAAHKENKAAAYYHFTMAHMYEEQMAAYGRSDLVSKAIERFLALHAPGIKRRWSGQLVKGARGLQELMTKTVVIKDSVQVGAEDAPVGADTSVHFFCY